MATILPKNMWGVPGGQDAQRSDLWIVDLNSVALWLKRKYGLTPLPENTSLYAHQVIMPEDRVNTDIIYRDSVPYNMPGFDAVLAEVRVDFVYDAPGASSTLASAAPALRADRTVGVPTTVLDVGEPATNPSMAKSRVATLLSAWKQLARVGRGARSGASQVLDVDLPSRIEDLNQLADAFKFQFDVDVYFLRGTMVDTLDSSVVKTFEIASAWRLVRCWCAAVQLGQLSYQQSDVYKITASLYPEDVVPYDPQRLTSFSRPVQDARLAIASRLA